MQPFHEVVAWCIYLYMNASSTAWVGSLSDTDQVHVRALQLPQSAMQLLSKTSFAAQ